MSDDLRIDILKKPTISGKMDVRFPAKVETENFLTVTKANGIYTFSVDYTKLAEMGITDPATAKIALLDESAQVYKLVSVADIVAGGLDADLQAIGALTGAGILERTGDDAWTLRAAPNGELVGTDDLATVATTGDYDDLTSKPYTVPAGGATGQVLAKASNADGDTGWVTGSGGGSFDFDTKADVEAANIPIIRMTLRTGGYAAAGDLGGALYKRVGSEPSHEGKIQSADGAWWEISEDILTVQMFWVDPDDCAAGFQAAFDAAFALGGKVVRCEGTFTTKNSASLTVTVLKPKKGTTVVIPRGSTIYSENVYGGYNSSLFTLDPGDDNVTFEGGGKIKAAPGFTLSGTVTSGNATVTGISDTSRVSVLMPVEGTNIQIGTTVVSKTSNSVTLSAAPTGNGTSITCHFTGGPFLSAFGVTGFKWFGVELMDIYSGAIAPCFKMMLSVKDSLIENLYADYEDRTSGYFAGQDAIHIFGGTDNLAIINPRGVSGDDFIAVNTEDAGQPDFDTETKGVKVIDPNIYSKVAHCVRVYKPSGVTSKIKKVDIIGLIGAANVDEAAFGLPCVYIADENGGDDIEDVTISGFDIDASTAGTHGIYAKGANRLKILGGKISGAAQNSVLLENSPNSTIDGVTSLGNQSSSYSAFSVSTGSTDAIVRGNRVLGGGSATAVEHGIEILEDGALVEGNFVLQAATDGIFTSASHGRIANNYVSGCNAWAIKENGGDYNVVIGNDGQTNGGGNVDRSTAGSHSIYTSNAGLDDSGPAWKAYTPTVTPPSGDTASATGRYKVDGKTLNLSIDLNVTAGTTAGAFQISLPTTNSTTALQQAMTCNNASGLPFGVLVPANSSVIFVALGAVSVGHYSITGAIEIQ